MTSNITFFDTANTLFDLVDGVNSNINNMFGLIIIGVLFIIIFIMFQNYEMKQILLFEGFALSLVCMILVFMGWLNITYFVIPAVILGFAIYFNAIK